MSLLPINMASRWPPYHGGLAMTRPIFLALVVALVLGGTAGYLIADDSTAVNTTAVNGTLSDSAGQPLATTNIEFWQGETKIGSTTTDADGGFSVELAGGGDTADAPVRVTTEVGFVEFNHADAAQPLVLRLSENGATADGFPVWLKTFFATILPLIVLAIVVLGIRNRRSGVRNQ